MSKYVIFHYGINFRSYIKLRFKPQISFNNKVLKVTWCNAQLIGLNAANATNFRFLWLAKIFRYLINKKASETEISVTEVHIIIPRTCSGK